MTPRAGSKISITRFSVLAKLNFSVLKSVFPPGPATDLCPYLRDTISTSHAMLRVKSTDSDVLIDGCLFEACYANGEGGGMFHSTGSMSVVGSMFYNNTAGGDNAEDGEVQVAFMVYSMSPIVFLLYLYSAAQRVLYCRDAAVLRVGHLHETPRFRSVQTLRRYIKSKG